MSEREAYGVLPLTGISFEIDELRALRALALPGIRVGIDTASDRTVEELIVFRLQSEPAVVAATLRRSPTGPYKLVGYDLSGEANEPLIEASFPDFDLTLYALRELFSEEYV